MTSPLTKIACIAPTLLLLSCSSPGNSSSSLPPVSSIPASVSKEGTIANAKLGDDATNALFAKLQIPEAERSQVKIAKFVIQQPAGSTGKKAWREMWILIKEGKAGRQFIVTFQEDGKGSADFRFEG